MYNILYAYCLYTQHNAVSAEVQDDVKVENLLISCVRVRMLVFTNFKIVDLIGLESYPPEGKIIVFLFIIKRNKNVVIHKKIVLLLPEPQH